MSTAKTLATLVAMVIPSLAGAVEYTCAVTKKWDVEGVYTDERLAKWNFTVKIEEKSHGAFISRCSFSAFADRETCDRYAVDRTEFDEIVAIKKFYVFASQLDVQLFSDLTMLENNGRGTIASGKCVVTSP